MKRLTSLLISLLLIATLMISTYLPAEAASVDVLAGKKIHFVGDDTTLALYSGIKATYDPDVYYLISSASSSGVTLSDWRAKSSGLIHKQFSGIQPKSTDYVILGGGLADLEKRNDGSGDTTEGVVPGIINPHDFSLPLNEVDAKNMEALTFAAGVERLIKNAITKLDGKRIGFIINHATPYNNAVTARTPEKHWEVIRKACEKWNIPYLDLYAGKASDGRSYSYDILDLDNPASSNMSSSKKKLSTAGAKLIAPYIMEWIAGLQPYNLKQTLATAPTTTVGTGKTLPTTTTTTTAKKTTTTTKGKVTTTVEENAPTTTKTKYNIVVNSGSGETVTRPVTTTEATAAQTQAEQSGTISTTLLILLIVLGVVIVSIVVMVILLTIRKKK